MGVQEFDILKFLPLFTPQKIRIRDDFFNFANKIQTFKLFIRSHAILHWNTIWVVDKSTECLQQFKCSYLLAFNHVFNIRTTILDSF